MALPKEEMGLNPISNKVIIKTRKINQKIKKDKKREIEDKLYPLENYRQLKTTQQFWKKNENPIYKDFNKKNEQQIVNNIKKIKNENKTLYQEINKNNENEDMTNKTLNIKTPQKLKPIKNKLNDERKEDDNICEIKPEKKEVSVVKETDTNNQNKQNNDIDNKVNDKENEQKNKEDIKDPLLEDDLYENENIDDVINYLNDLDYDKYCKDMEIREALTLLKNKIDKEKEEKDKEGEKNKNKIIIEGVEQNKDDKNEKEEDKKNSNEENIEKKIILPEINTKIPEQNPIEIVNEEELKRKEEIKKYKIAEQKGKTDQMKAVHSVNSIKKLLQREGFDKMKEVAPLKITVIKENPLANSDGYEANKLPFLHSLPLV